MFFSFLLLLCRVRITIDQVVAQFNTKLEINPAHWSVELGKASGRTAEAVHINSMLESIRSTVHQHYHALMAQDGYVTAELVKNAFLGKIARERTLIEFFKQHNEQYLQKVKMNTTDKTYSRYELTKKRLIEFMKFLFALLPQGERRARHRGARRVPHPPV